MNSIAIFTERESIRRRVKSKVVPISVGRAFDLSGSQEAVIVKSAVAATMTRLGCCRRSTWKATTPLPRAVSCLWIPMRMHPLHAHQCHHQYRSKAQTLFTFYFVDHVTQMSRFIVVLWLKKGYVNVTFSRFYQGYYFRKANVGYSLWCLKNCNLV